MSPGPAEATLIPVGNFSPEVLQLCNITEVPDIDPSVIDFLGERQTFTTENSEVSYHRFGNTTSDRPAIVLVNGFTNTQLSWPLDLLAALAEDQEVITFDNRGIGYSKVRRAEGVQRDGGGGARAAKDVSCGRAKERVHDEVEGCVQEATACAGAVPLAYARREPPARAQRIQPRTCGRTHHRRMRLE